MNLVNGVRVTDAERPVPGVRYAVVAKPAYVVDVEPVPRNTVAVVHDDGDRVLVRGVHEAPKIRPIAETLVHAEVTDR
jgi:hypothetical protein